MMEVLTESVRLVNLPFTVLMACVVLYWLIVCLGLLDFNAGADADVSADADVHADVGAHAELHADGDADVHAGDHNAGHSSGGWLSPLLQFLNVGEVPMMVIVSILVLCMWTVSLIVNHYWTGGSPWLALAFLVPNLVVSCLVTKVVSHPFKSLFKALNKEYDEHEPIVGRTCTIVTTEVNSQFGQARIDRKGAPLLINVRTSEDAVLEKGDTGLVIKEDKEKGVYTIIKVTADKLEV